jgi:hypothetical protein
VSCDRSRARRLSLDIDRNTWWVWRALAFLRPRVVVAEYNAVWPAGVDWTIDYQEERASKAILMDEGQGTKDKGTPCHRAVAPS